MVTDRQRKLFITSIGKHLESCGAEFKKKSDSKSTYYTLGPLTIRVSDHIATSNNHADLNIVASVNDASQTIVIMNGGVFVYNSIKDLKSFLSSWCLFKTCEIFTASSIKDTELNRANRELETVKNEITVLESKKETLSNELREAVIDTGTSAVFEEWQRTMKTLGEEDMIANLNAKQRASLFKQMITYNEQNKKTKKSSSPKKTISKKIEITPTIQK